MALKIAGLGGRSITTTPVDLIEQLAQLPETIRKQVLKKALLTLGKQQKELITKGLRGGTFRIKELAASTILARQLGKESGLTPERPKKPAAKNPLYYTGTTARGITVKVVGESLVIVGPSFDQIPYSGSSAVLAATYQELGFRTQGKYTAKQLAYLHILFRKGKKRDPQDRSAGLSGKPGGARVGTGYSRTVPARPAWDQARKEVLTHVPQVLKDQIKVGLATKGLVVT